MTPMPGALCLCVSPETCEDVYNCSCAVYKAVQSSGHQHNRSWSTDAGQVQNLLGRYVQSVQNSLVKATNKCPDSKICWPECMSRLQSLQCQCSVNVKVLITMIVEIALFLVTIILGLILFLRRNYGTLERMGVPVVKPAILGLGSDPFNIHKTNYINEDMKNFKKYGKIWGSYSISSPWLNITDPDLIKVNKMLMSSYLNKHYCVGGLRLGEICDGKELGLGQSGFSCFQRSS